MAYHLGLVHLWSHAHGLLRLKDMYAALPSGMEMLFLFAFTIGRHSSAALVHFSFLMLLPVLVVLYGIRLGCPGGLPFAAIVVFATPLVGWDGSVAYNDVALMVVGFAAVYCLQMWRSDRSTGSLTAACVLAGFAAAIKYTGSFFFLFVAATAIWELRRESGTRIARTALAAAALGALAPLPYLVRNCIWFHNPIAFFGNSIFRTPYFHVSFEKAYIWGQAHLEGVTWSDLPLNLTIGGSKLPQSLGPIYLLAPIALLGLIWPQSRFFVLATLVVGSPYAGNKAARFLLPVLPFVFLAIGCVLRRIPRAGGVALGALSIVQLIISWPGAVERIHTPRVEDLFIATGKSALRREPEDRYLRRIAVQYPMARLIESLVPQGQTVFALEGGVAQSYTTRPILDSFRSADAERAVDLFYGNADSPEFGGRKWTAAFPELRARQLRILQAGRSAEALWSIDEIRLWRGGEVVSPERSWHVDAFPNPWDIGFAFDGVEGTRWKSWEAIRPGMWVAIRFDAPQSMDRVEIVSLDPQWDSQMDLRILTEAGRWQQLPGVWQANPPMDARKNATQELKREGVHFVVVRRSASNSRILTNVPTAWGLREVASCEDSILYRID